MARARLVLKVEEMQRKSGLEAGGGRMVEQVEYWRKGGGEAGGTECRCCNTGGRDT